MNPRMSFNSARAPSTQPLPFWAFRDDPAGWLILVCVARMYVSIRFWARSHPECPQYTWWGNRIEPILRSSSKFQIECVRDKRKLDRSPAMTALERVHASADINVTSLAVLVIFYSARCSKEALRNQHLQQ